MIAKWLKQRWAITKIYWAWLWMSRAQRRQAKAARTLFFNVLGNAPLDKIKAGKGCSWSMTPKQRRGTALGIQAYVKAVTGEDVKMAKEFTDETKAAAS